MPRAGRWWLLAAVGVVAALRPFRVEVAGSSMEPTLRPGDWLVATRAGRVHRGCVVVLRHPERDLALVKRAVSLPGDFVGERALGVDEYLVLGDNEAASTDGRAFGPVGRNAIEGIVRFRYRRRLTSS